MRRALTEEEKYKQMMEEPVNTLIPRLAIPSMVSMVVVAIYNMADTFFCVPTRNLRFRCGGHRLFDDGDYSGDCFYDRDGMRK